MSRHLNASGGRSKAEAFDALAELFLGDPSIARTGIFPNTASQTVPTLRLVTDPAPEHVPAPTTAAPPRLARVEGLVLGHLPVLASAWVMQYARHVAQNEPGPIALLRLRAGEGTLEIVRAAPGSILGVESRFASLREATEHLAGMVSAWLIRVEESAEAMLADLGDLTQLTLLSGADEAAVVAAYTAIKRLSPADQDAKSPALRLAIMGASADKGTASAAKLTRTAESFLKRTIDVTACVGRIAGGVRSELAWSGRIEAPIEETLRWVCRAARSRPFTPAMSLTAPAPAPSPMAAVRLEMEAVAAEQPEPELQPVAAALVAPPAIPPFEPTMPTAPSPTLTPIPTPMFDFDLASAQPRIGSLSRHIPSLQSLSLSCPYTTGVELATTEDGTLHLLALEGAAADQPALPRLITAAAWVRDHLPILKLAAPAEGRRISDAEPVLHLLTTSAPTVRRLTESGVRLHVLVSSKTADGPVWACADLN